jgi:hypothetical protein
LRSSHFTDENLQPTGNHRDQQLVKNGRADITLRKACAAGFSTQVGIISNKSNHRENCRALK